MRTYTMHKVRGVPDWSTIPVLPIDHFLWLDPVNVSAQAQICWDDEAIYIRMEAEEPRLRMRETGLLAEVCEDSCMEFFLQPTQRPEYLNFEMNPDRAMWLGIGVDADTRIRLLVPEVETLLDVRSAYTLNGWKLTYRIPFSFIRIFFPDFEAKEGLCVRGNVYKCGEKTADPHFMAWCPTVYEEPNFHMSEYFGCFVFGNEQEAS